MSNEQPRIWWRVEVTGDEGKQLVSIEPSMLAGKGDLTDGELDTIRMCARALMYFAGPPAEPRSMNPKPDNSLFRLLLIFAAVVALMSLIGWLSM